MAGEIVIRNVAPPEGAPRRGRALPTDRVILDDRREVRPTDNLGWFDDIRKPIRAAVLDRADARNAERAEQTVNLKGDAFARPIRREIEQPWTAERLEATLAAEIDYANVQSHHNSGGGYWTRAELADEEQRLRAAGLL